MASMTESADSPHTGAVDRRRSSFPSSEKREKILSNSKHTQKGPGAGSLPPSTFKSSTRLGESSENEEIQLDHLAVSS